MDVDESDRKRTVEDGKSTNTVTKRQRQTDTETHSDSKNDDVGEEILAWLTLDDEAISELLNFLDPNPNPNSSTNCPDSATTASSAVANFKVKFIDHPYLSPLSFRSSSSYVTINGNEESCGSSFSVLDSDSSLMASIDTRGVKLSLSNDDGTVGKGTKSSLETGGGGAWDGSEDDEEARGWLKEYGGSDDGVVGGFGELVWDDDDDDGLSRFLGDEEGLSAMNK